MNGLLDWLPRTITPTALARGVLKFNPNPKQTEVLESSVPRGILCCSRQWGKSTTVAVKSVHHALLEHFHILCTSSYVRYPQLRQ